MTIRFVLDGGPSSEFSPDLEPPIDISFTSAKQRKGTGDHLVILHESAGVEDRPAVTRYLQQRHWGVHLFAMPTGPVVTADFDVRLAHSRHMPNAIGIEMPWRYYPRSVHEPHVRGAWVHFRRKSPVPGCYAVPPLTQLEAAFDAAITALTIIGCKIATIGRVAKGVYDFRGAVHVGGGASHALISHSRIVSDGHADGVFPEAYCVARVCGLEPADAASWAIIISEASARKGAGTAFTLPRSAVA